MKKTKTNEMKKKEMEMKKKKKKKKRQRKQLGARMVCNTIPLSRLHGKMVLLRNPPFTPEAACPLGGMWSNNEPLPKFQEVVCGRQLFSYRTFEFLKTDMTIYMFMLFWH